MNSLYKEKTNQLRSIAKRALEIEVISQSVYDDFDSRIQNNEFKITVVGEFSSGKSTLIDALIGEDVLPHSASETTATLTYIHNVERGNPKERTAEIFFSDGNIKKVDFSELKEYVTAFSKTLDVFVAIEYVNVYVHLESLDGNIVIVDTPGLNGTNHYEDRTLEEISKADASIFVFSTSGVRATEQTFMMEELLKHQSSFFFVMNRIDDLHSSEGDTVETELIKFEREISERFFNGRQKAANVFGVSSLKALVAKDRKIEKLYIDDKNFICDEDRDRLWRESRFEDFLRSLEKYLKDEKEKVFVNSLAEQLSLLLGESLQHIEDDLVSILPKDELPAAAIIKDEIETAKSRFESYERGLNKNVNAKIEEVENNIRAKSIEIVNCGEKRCNEVNLQIDAIKSIDEFNKVYGEDGSRASVIVNGFYNRYFDVMRTAINEGIASVENKMLQEIRQLIPNIAFLKKDSVGSVNIGKKTFSFKSTNGISEVKERIRECDEKIIQLQAQQDSALDKQSRINEEQSDLNSKANSLQIELANVNCRIRSMGVRPEAKWVTTTTIVYVERSKLNPARWFGNKYKEKKEKCSVYDDSAQREYDRKRQNLDSEKNSLNSRLSDIYNKIDNLPDMEIELRTIAHNIERQIKEKEYQLKELEREKAVQRKEMDAGRESFLNKRKIDLKNALRGILANENSDMHRFLRNDAMKYLAEAKGILTSIIHSYFKEESGRYIEQLYVMLDNISSVIENGKMEQKRITLNVSKDKLRDLLDDIMNVTK